MLYQFDRLIAPYRKTFSRLTQLPTAIVAIGGIVLGLSIAKAQQPNTVAYAAEASPAIETTAIAQASFLADGVYLYGQSPESEQLNTSYMVFEVRQNQAVGLFYMPHSSFDCFYGNLNTDRLAVTIVDSYENTPYNYALNLDSSTIASTHPIPDPNFEGFHRIADVSANDYRMLEMCKASYQQEVW
ncbi:MAG: hypothetical protein WBC69_18745 [Geitlerinemataceae cyanobacterium]